MQGALRCVGVGPLRSSATPVERSDQSVIVARSVIMVRARGDVYGLSRLRGMCRSYV